MRITLICGSVRECSYTKVLLKSLQKEIKRKFNTVEVDLVDLSETPLPIFDGSDINKKNAEIFIDRIDKADGFIIASPEYHNSFSGVLKNAFDYLSSAQIKNKPIGIIAVSGGGKGGINCLNGMRTFLRGLNGLVLPDQVVVDNQYVINNHCVNEELLLRIKGLVEEVLNFSYLTGLKNEKPLNSQLYTFV